MTNSTPRGDAPQDVHLPNPDARVIGAPALHDLERLDTELDRWVVPGGWIYVVPCWGDTDQNTRPIFVPDPSPQFPAPALTGEERAFFGDVADILRERGYKGTAGHMLSIIDRLLGKGGAA